MVCWHFCWHFSRPELVAFRVQKRSIKKTDETTEKLKTQEDNLADSRAAFSNDMGAFDVGGID
jgi:hypothetical protein